MVIQTIAATRTRTGLRVEAVLDTGDYPTGIAISKDRFAALPLEHHAVHGPWNYTLHPQIAGDTLLPDPVGEAVGPAQRRQTMLAKLANERLTGLSAEQLEHLTVTLASAQAARTQQRFSEQRGGRARRATGKLRHKPLFDDSARLLLTLLYQRQVCSMNVLADLLEVTATCSASHIHETREVLENLGHVPGTAPVRLPTAPALQAFLDSDQQPTRTEIINKLSHPELTGMSRPDLRTLISRMAPRQIAQTERVSYERRGGEPSQATAKASSHRNSVTTSASSSPSFTCGNCAPWTSSPTPWAT